MIQSDRLSRIRVILNHPRSPGNVGAVARAMKNMGFATLRIADPARYDNPAFFDGEAARMAWGAGDLLKAREEYPTIASAVADAVLVAGTTSRPPAGRRGISPRALAPLLLEAARKGPVALLFGSEESGLTHDALARCPIVGTIPSADAYTTLNLAQSVLLVAYELRAAAVACTVHSPEREPVSADDLDELYRVGEAALSHIDYLKLHNRDRVFTELGQLLTRAEPSTTEIQSMRALCTHISRLPGR